MGSNPAPQGGNVPLPSSSSQPIDPKLLRHKLQVLAWMRVGLGAFAGVLAGMLNLITVTTATFNPNAYAGFYVAFFVYFGTYYAAKYWLRLPEFLAQKDKNKMITQGIGSYIMMFVFFWIIYNTLCFTSFCLTFNFGF